MMRQVQHNNWAMKLLWAFLKLFCVFSKNSFFNPFAPEQRGEFHISHDASRQISVFSPLWKERSRVSREIFNDLNFKMQLIQGKF